ITDQKLSVAEVARRFEVRVGGSGSAAGTAEVFLAGTSVGTFNLTGGAGTFGRTFDLDAGGVPEVHAGSAVEVKLGGATLLSGTLGNKINLLVNPGFDDGLWHDPRNGWVAGGNITPGAERY